MKYFAFISYSRKDTAWGKRLQRKLENYRLPAIVYKKHGWEKKPLSPIFFAPTDIQPGCLSEELKTRLRESRNLIVVCSPNSARSKWVGQEISFFCRLGRVENLHLFIIDGIPNSGSPDTECIHPVISELGIPEILGVNVREKIYRLPWMNRERAFIQLITKLLGIEYDELWQRHRRALIRRFVLLLSAVFLFVFTTVSAVRLSKPIDIDLRLKECTSRNDFLPPLKDASAVLAFQDDTLSVRVPGADETGVIVRNIPHRYLGKPVSVSVRADGFLPFASQMNLSRILEVGLERDPDRYGRIRYKLWDPEAERPMPGIWVEIAGLRVVSDENGMIRMDIPLQSQRVRYPVKAAIPLRDSVISATSTKNSIILAE